MPIHHPPMGLIAAAAALAAPMGADAATKAPDAAALAAQLAQAQQQLVRLQARIDALEARLNAAAPKEAPALAEAAPPPAPEPKAEAALATVEKVQKAQARSDRALAAVRWAADTTVSGQLYLNASNITQHTSGGANPNSGLGVNLKRAFVSVDHRFSRVWAAHLTLDADNALGQTATTNPSTAATPQILGKGLYVRKAYGEARLAPQLTLRLGSADLPWIAYSEGIADLRHIERSPLERIGYGNPADWGIHALGELLPAAGPQGPSLSYALSVVNGAGYRQVRVTNSVDVEGRISARYRGLYAAIGGYTGQRGNDVQAVGTTPSTYRGAQRLDAALGYRGLLGGLGVEYMRAKNWNNITINPATYALPQDRAVAWSVAGDYSLSRRWRAFARYDLVKPNELTLPRLRDDYMLAGLQFSPLAPISVALVYKHEVVKGGALTTANGVIGCSGTATANAFTTAALAAATCTGNGSYDEIGLFSQVKF